MSPEVTRQSTQGPRRTRPAKAREVVVAEDLRIDGVGQRIGDPRDIRERIVGQLNLLERASSATGSYTPAGGAGEAAKRVVAGAVAAGRLVAEANQRGVSQRAQRAQRTQRRPHTSAAAARRSGQPASCHQAWRDVTQEA